jgi:carbon storage regulator CsrA
MRAETDSARKAENFQRTIHKKTTVFVFFIGSHRSKALGGSTPMLIISRKKDQKIILADNIEITILEVGRNRVRFGVKAPRNIPIHTKLKGTEPEIVGVASETGDEPARVRAAGAFSAD